MPIIMKPRAGLELALALAAVLAVFVVASALDLHERVQSFTAPLERWQLDEMVFALLAACMALAVFAIRRWREAAAQLRAREQAEAALGELGRRHRDLAHRVIVLQEAERRQLAREVHDHLGQTCCVIRVEAATLLEQPQSTPMHDGLRRIAAAADELYESCHDLLAVLRPQDLEALGLPAAVQALLQGWEPSARVQCLFYPEGDFDGLDPAVSLALYRIVQESLSNVMRHARARRVLVRLTRGQQGGIDAIRLIVEDDGVGRRAQRPGRRDGREPRGLGLVGMQERASMVGGVIAFRDLASHGFVVDCRVPFAQAHRRAGAGGLPAALAPQR